MAKPTAEQWAKARALYEAGKSLREIEKETKINYRTVDRMAKKETWNQGGLSQLIHDTARVKAEFVTLEMSQQAIVSKEVARILDGKEFYATNARKAVKMGLVALSKDPTPAGMKTVMDGMKTGMIVEGLVPFYPAPASISNTNTNAQQNNTPADWLREIAEKLPV